MAESEVYRIEIPIIVDDQSDAPLERAKEKVSRFEKEARKKNEMIRKHFETLAKMQIEPVIKIRDQLTASVLKADALIKKLSIEQASPVIAAQDRVSTVVTRTSAILDAMQKGKYEVLADMKGPLMDEIVKAKSALAALNGVKAGPVAELRGELFGQLTRAMSQLKGLNEFEARPEVTLKEKVFWRAKEIESTLRGLASRVWSVTIQAKDKVTDVVKRVLGIATSPLALLGAGAGATATIIYPLKLAGEMEQARIAMEFFTESTEKGQEFMKRLQAFAAKTPFEFPDVREAAVGLMPLYKEMYGVDKAMEETIRTIQAFGDAAGLTGAGINGMKLALLGFKQIGTMGKLQMEELRQVTENLLIPMGPILDELGVARDALSDLGRANIDAKIAMEAIIRTLEKKYRGGLEKMSQSLFGLTSTVKDTANLTVAAFGAGMAEPVRRILFDLVGITDYTGKKYEIFKAKLAEAGRKIGEAFERAYSKIKNVWAELSAVENMGLPDKIVLMLDKMMDSITAWASGPGGKKIEKLFVKLAEIGTRAWLAAIVAMLKGSLKSLFSGNFVSAVGLGAGAVALGGGLLLRGAVSAGKGVWNAGKWAVGKVRPRATAEALEKVAGVAETTAKSATKSRLPFLTRVSEASKPVVGKAGSMLKSVAEKLPSLGKVGKFLGRAALPLAVAVELVDVARAKDKTKALLQGIGGISGSIGGAKLGAMIGTAIAPGIGTAIGGVLGGIGGYLAGALGGTKLLAWLKQMDFAALKEKAISWIKTLPGEAAQYLGYVAGYASEKLSQLPGLFSNWFRQAKDSAIQWIKGLPDKIAEFVASIPERVSSAIKTVKEVFTALGRAIPEAIIAGINWGKARLNVAERWLFEKAIAGIEAAKYLKERAAKGYEAGQQAARNVKVAAHAYGGILTRPHLGLVAEAGPEAIIPLSARMRHRALALYEETGRRLGVRPYDEGGFAGYVPVAVPAMAGVVSPNMPSATINMNFDLAGLVGQIVVNNQTDLDSAIDRITEAIADNLRGIFRNMTRK